MSSLYLKINSRCEKQIILLMIPNEEKGGWHYLSVKNIYITKRNNVKTNIMVIFIA